MAVVESGLPKVQQEPSEAPQIGVENNGAENVPKDEPRLSSSECVVSIKEKPEQPHQCDMECSGAKLSIYRIPHYLKEGDDKAYVPQIVSLGPYHHGEEKLRPMDQHKLRCWHRILERSHHEEGLYLNSVKEVEQRARACYERTISMSSNDFMQMMVLDGCFVIELLRGVTEGFEKLGYPCNDPVFSKWGSRLRIQIQRDMIMLENQIPLFILSQLLSLQLSTPDQKGDVVKLVLQFFGALTKPESEREKLDPSSDQCGLHCLDVFWRSLLPSDLSHLPSNLRLLPSNLRPRRTQGWEQRRPHLIPCVTKLREDGVKIRRANWNKSLEDIKFNVTDGILDIPSLEIHEGTRSLFLNLIAFEQSHFDCGNHFTSYVIFMHNLINSREDVEYLCNHRIIKHCLGSDSEVADLFNRLCQDVAFDIEDSYLGGLSAEVKFYYIPVWMSSRERLVQNWNYFVRKWESWRANLKNKYFDSPWSIISFAAAFVFACAYFHTNFVWSLWLLQAGFLISPIVEII